MAKIELTPEQAKQLYLNITAYHLHLTCASNIDKFFFKRLKFWNPTMNAVIRIFDLAGAQGFDLGGALVEKLKYNQKRQDHQKENREAKNGKKF